MKRNLVIAVGNPTECYFEIKDVREISETKGAVIMLWLGGGGVVFFFGLLEYMAEKKKKRETKKKKRQRFFFFLYRSGEWMHRYHTNMIQIIDIYNCRPICCPKYDGF